MNKILRYYIIAIGYVGFVLATWDIWHNGFGKTAVACEVSSILLVVCLLSRFKEKEE